VTYDIVSIYTAAREINSRRRGNKILTEKSKPEINNPMELAKKFLTAAAIMATWLAASQLRAQGTAFTYNGKLNDGANPANGSYDLRFALFTAVTNGNAAGSLTNTATGISNGLFTVTLDFGSVFNGSNYWLEIAARTNGGGTFSTLIPRQPILPTPYAIYAINAGNAATAATANGVATGTITGAGIQDATITAAKIAGGQVVKSLNGLTDAVSLSAGANVRLTPSGNTVQISAGSSGAMSWQVVAGTNVQAAANTGYVVTNGAQVTVTLPASTNLFVGDVVRVASAGNGAWQIAQNAGQTIQGYSFNNGNGMGNDWTATATSLAWMGIASSADGTKLAATVVGGQIWTCSTTGFGFFGAGVFLPPNQLSWLAHASNQRWQGIASSADGTKLAAVANPGQIWTSTNSGVTWTAASNTSNNWFCIASSADGTKLSAGGNLPGIWTSTNSGATWTIGPTNTVVNSDWNCIASSSDGTKLAAVGISGFFTSTDSGATWTSHTNNFYWIASSADGTKLAATQGEGRIWTSTDSGVTWMARANSQVWTGIASSADGTKLAAVIQNGPICTSTDSGASWTAAGISQDWQRITSSADGTRLAAIGLTATGVSGPIYTSASAAASGTTNGSAGYLVGGQNTAIELQYVGNGQFIALSHEGTILAY
jgi:hypothetical protein